MRKDWVATIRGFARRDLKEGKMKLSSHKQQGGTNLTGGDQLPEDYGEASPTAITRQEFLNQKDKKEK